MQTLTFERSIRLSRISRFRSMDKATESLPICRRKYADIETGKAIPTAHEICQMAEAFCDKSLALKYCYEICPVHQMMKEQKNIA